MGEYTKKTRDSFAKIIRKPPLTDKLLSKPPFRFLHDIFTEVIRSTGFLDGLFTATEMDSKNVSAKEDKMLFLQKVIDVVAIVSGDQLSVRPSKIVAGQEPDKTNELLQAIARCIKKNLSSDEAVQQVVSGKPAKIQEKPPAGSSKRREGKENREQNDDSRRKKRDKEGEKDRDRSSDRRHRSAGKERSREKGSNREQGAAGEGSEEIPREQNSEKSRDRSERHKEERSRERRDDKKERRSRRSRSTSRTKLKGDEPSGSKKPHDKTQSPAKQPSQKSLTKEKQRHVEARNKKRPPEKKEEQKPKKSESRKDEDHEEAEQEDRGSRGRSREDEEPEQNEKHEEEEGTSPSGGSGRPPRPASAKGHRRRPAQDRSSRGGAPDGQDEGSQERSRTKLARPPSARPAAPRVRQRPDPAEEEIARMESAGTQRTAPIIVDRGQRRDGEGLSSDEDEDDQFLVQEEDIQAPEMDKLSPLPNGEVNGDADDEDAEHGGLVRKILETKKEIETSAAKGAKVTGKPKVEIERTPVNEVQRRKERELVMRDIEKLRGSVQKLCRSAVPLGKIIDYIQEDMDSMQNELIQWRKENKKQAARLKEEESVTEKTIEPLKAELEELDRSIAAQLDMIAASKCNVLSNQDKIDKMVAGVTARS